MLLLLNNNFVYLDKSVHPSAAWSLSCSCTQSCRWCCGRSARSRRSEAHTRRYLRRTGWCTLAGPFSLYEKRAALDVNSEADLCMFFRPAAAWSRQGSCSARLWMCLYRCSRTPHCSLRRFLKLQHTRWVRATLFLNVKCGILRKTEPLLGEGCALNTERPISE